MYKKEKNSPVFSDIMVTDVADKGRGVGLLPDGKVIFLKNVVPGDVVTAFISKKRRSYCEGVATSFEKLSEKRITPKCEHFGVCGGCKWQNLSYSEQLAFKQKEVLDNLKRIGKVLPKDVLPIVGAENDYFYRNKMEFSFSDNRWLSVEELKASEPLESRNALGFHISGMWDKVLDVTNCYIQEEPSNTIRRAIKQFAIKNDLSFFNIKQKKGLLRTLMIRISSTKELMILIQFGERDEAQQTKILDFVASEFPKIDALLYTVNEKGNDSLYDQDIKCYKGKDYITEEMEGLKFKVGAKSFYQTNSVQAYNLYKIVREFAALKGTEFVYDLYTGTGTIALFLAKHSKKVIGIETVPEAVENAKENAEVNNISNVDFFVGDVAKLFRDSFTDTHPKPDVVVVDPPREGIHRSVLEQILKVMPEKIVYVSCNSATQARDLEILTKSYIVTKSQAVDMFPQTHHIENIVLLERLL